MWGSDWFVLAGIALIISETMTMKSKLIPEGWKRLSILIMLLWMAILVIIAIAEHQRINPFDQFDQPPSLYWFWQWTPPITHTDAAASQRELQLRLIPFLTILLLPIGLLWSTIVGIFWVKSGFSIEAEEAP